MSGGSPAACVAACVGVDNGPSVEDKEGAADVIGVELATG